MRFRLDSLVQYVVPARTGSIIEYTAASQGMRGQPDRVYARVLLDGRVADHTEGSPSMPEQPLRPMRATGLVDREPEPASRRMIQRDTGVDVLARAASDTEGIGRLYEARFGPIYHYVAMRLRQREDADSRVRRPPCP